MSLALRLLLALGVVAVAVTALVGFFARDVSREEVERVYKQRIDGAMKGARADLVFEAQALSKLLAPMCEHDSFVDRALLEGCRAAALQLRVFTVNERADMLRFVELGVDGIVTDRPDVLREVAGR